MSFNLMYFVVLIGLFVSCESVDNMPVQLLVEYADRPLGIEQSSPRFSWHSQIEGQIAYQIQVANTLADLREGENLMWDSQKIEFNSNINIEYKGSGLESMNRYYWHVRVWNENDAVSEWSEPSWWETAILNSSEWQAEWIAGPERITSELTIEQGLADDEEISASDEFCRPIDWFHVEYFASQIPNNQGECREIRPAPMLRKSFEINKEIANARIYTSGLAYNDLSLNGVPTSESVLDPGFTNYSKTVLYSTYNVTDLLEQGENVIATVLGSGQFDSSVRTWDWGWVNAEWRATPQLLLQLVIEYVDGTEKMVITDDSWKVSTNGPTRFDSYYVGETYDARRNIDGWREPGFDDTVWQYVRVVDAPAGTLRAQLQESIQIVKTLEPGMRTEPEPGVVVYDIGQNLSGWATVSIDAPEETAIEIFYSEKLDSDGKASTEGNALVSSQLQTDYYISDGSGEVEWTPRFSYKGFRYLMISGPEMTPLSDDVTVEVKEIQQLRTGYPESSELQISHPLLQKLHNNTKWAYESNSHGIITDTPIYEKNAWTGDAQLTAGVGALLFNTSRLNQKLFQDMIDAQKEDGEVPHLAPTNENYGYVGKPAFKPADCCGATPAWDAFWFINPWESYMRFGDIKGLEKTYPAMKLYLDHWIPQWTDKDEDNYEFTLTAGLGDWDTPQIPEEVPRNISLSSTAYYAHFAQIASDVAGILGFEEDVNQYEELFSNIQRDFNARFYSEEEGFYKENADTEFTQTAQILPLAFDLVPDDLRSEIAAQLADDIENNRGGNPYVGILGARYIMPVLTEAGYADIAYNTATQTDYPSWGYWIEELGWTALGEHWEADTRSRNHHFFGTPVQWMYEELAGIKPIEPGYKKIEFKPYIPEELERISVTYESMMGTIQSEWVQDNENVNINITVPGNSRGRVYIPALNRENVNIESDNGEGSITFIEETDGRVIYEMGTGSYQFSISK
jgi:alpha-L-rhamnosidase